MPPKERRAERLRLSLYATGDNKMVDYNLYPWYPHKVEIPSNIPEERHAEVRMWMISSVEEDNWNVVKIDGKVYAAFVNLEDAVAFKTVWQIDDDPDRDE